MTAKATVEKPTQPVNHAYYIDGYGRRIEVEFVREADWPVIQVWRRRDTGSHVFLAQDTIQQDRRAP